MENANVATQHQPSPISPSFPVTASSGNSSSTSLSSGSLRVAASNPFSSRWPHWDICQHKFLICCSLSHNKCCACLDDRQHAPAYPRYVFLVTSTSDITAVILCTFFYFFFPFPPFTIIARCLLPKIFVAVLSILFFITIVLQEFLSHVGFWKFILMKKKLKRRISWNKDPYLHTKTNGEKALKIQVRDHFSGWNIFGGTCFCVPCPATDKREQKKQNHPPRKERTWEFLESKRLRRRIAIAI